MCYKSFIKVIYVIDVGTTDHNYIFNNNKNQIMFCDYPNDATCAGEDGILSLQKILSVSAGLYLGIKSLL